MSKQTTTVKLAPRGLRCTACHVNPAVYYIDFGDYHAEIICEGCKDNLSTGLSFVRSQAEFEGFVAEEEK